MAEKVMKLKKWDAILQDGIWKVLCICTVIPLLIYLNVGNAAENLILTHHISLAVNDLSVWSIDTYQVKDADYGVVPATICFKNTKNKKCYRNSKKYGVTSYPFQVVTKLSTLPSETGFNGVLVKSEHTGTVSGLTALDIWKYDIAKKQFVSLLSNCILQGNASYRVVVKMNKTFLVTAERRWLEGESSEDKHYFHIKGYEIGTSSSKELFSYLTMKKFYEEDNVIEVELPGATERIANYFKGNK